MALVFPDDPLVGDTTFTGGLYWEWDGERWLKVSDLERGETGFTGSIGFTGSRGFTGSIGPAGAPVDKEFFVGDGITFRYILKYGVNAPVNIFVMVNGLVLMPDIDYTIENGNELVLNEPPNDLADIEVRYFQESGYQGSLGFRGSTGYTGSVGYKGSNGLAQVYLSPVAPPVEERIDGELWWDTENGILNIYYTEEGTWVGIAQGPRGARGYVGSRGYDGSVGPQGVGFAGSVGPTGFAGSRGNTGFAGSQGLAGTTGFAGSRGERGEAAAVGYTGSQGAAGAQGPIGLTGLRGSIGYAGSEGRAGTSANSFGTIIITDADVVIQDIVSTMPGDSFTLANGAGITFTTNNKILTINATAVGSAPPSNYTLSTSVPSGGNNGDVWYRYTL